MNSIFAGSPKIPDRPLPLPLPAPGAPIVGQDLRLSWQRGLLWTRQPMFPQQVQKGLFQGRPLPQTAVLQERLVSMEMGICLLESNMNNTEDQI